MFSNHVSTETLGHMARHAVDLAFVDEDQCPIRAKSIVCDVCCEIQAQHLIRFDDTDSESERVKSKSEMVPHSFSRCILTFVSVEAQPPRSQKHSVSWYALRCAVRWLEFA